MLRLVPHGPSTRSELRTSSQPCPTTSTVLIIVRQRNVHLVHSDCMGAVSTTCIHFSRDITQPLITAYTSGNTIINNLVIQTKPSLEPSYSMFSGVLYPSTITHIREASNACRYRLKYCLAFDSHQ